jgi:hypothetical protein
MLEYGTGRGRHDKQSAGRAQELKSWVKDSPEWGHFRDIKAGVQLLAYRNPEALAG